MGNATAIIRKNAAWYAVSIAISGLSSFGGIFLTKNNLSSNEFIHFNLQMSGITLFNTVMLGWLAQGITRFYHLHQSQFTNVRVLIVTLVTSLLVSTPLFLLWVNFVNLGQHLWYPISFLILNAIYLAFLGRTQAALNARNSAVSETIRNIVIVIILGLPFIANIKVNEAYYWIGWILSNVFSSLYLFFVVPKFNKKNVVSVNQPLPLDQQHYAGSTSIPFLHLIKKMLAFGLPISLWLLISAPVMNADKWYLSKQNFDKIAVANYLAIADIMMRGTLFMFAPLSSAAYPVLARMFDENKNDEVKKIIMKVIKWQVLMMVAAIAGFVMLHNVLFNFLHISSQSERPYFIIGILLMCFHSLWSISALLHKVAELQLRTSLLMIGNTAAAILSSFLLYVIVKPTTLIPVVFCFGSGIALYFIYCIFLFKNLRIKLCK